MTDDEMLRKLEIWAREYPASLSCRTDYSRGYRDGFVQAQEVVADMLDKRVKNLKGGGL